MSSRTLDISPLPYARLGGALYLTIILCGLFSEGFVMSQLVGADAAATARNILASPLLWRWAVAANVLLVLCALPLLWIEYLLLRPVNHALVMLSVVFNLASLAVEAVSKVFMLLVLPLLSSADYLAAFGPRQLPMLGHIALRLHDISFNVALIFFGCTCLLNGYLIYKSGYFPKVLGLLMQAAGGCYLVACTAALFAPELANVLLPTILLPCLIGELCMSLWLLLKGVNAAQWQARVSQVA
ncbi:DUF4386 domain-containing protein [Hymenobacter cellulosilyticus]|uniref:DUF4386 domain-containing protein n=1 Tax=Hymenobacter cellulosilyticus TaxID=2932248 RepID=A0A8T9Q898_9BACT|nr:DUF4386 domain-containing protein [Hymenobacter cellulosilyticus]UOQ73714.1 DUF4386 domain-containing protein [Hymenobacter cellulosilyticus]